MRVDSNRYMFRISVDRETLAGPENITKPLSMVELEDKLASNLNTGDTKLAELLSGFTLTERVNAARLARWKATFKGTETRQVLTALADASTFSPLPAQDLSKAPAPSLADQRRMMSLIGAYLGKTLSGLPNFLAERRTTYFEDWPSNVDWPAASLKSAITDPNDPARWRNRPFYSAGTINRPVTYRDGQEVIEKKWFSASNLNPYGARLTTSGEFGPILNGVLTDAAQSKLFWSAWEQSSEGALAVFRFEVPKEKSHYAVKLPGAPASSEGQIVPYRGEIAVKPADGSILRLTVMAQMGSEESVQAANIQVEYGRVKIGGKTYICPIHGVALSKVPVPGLRKKVQLSTAPLQTQLNDISFEKYRVFRGDLHVIPEKSN